MTATLITAIYTVMITKGRKWPLIKSNKHKDYQRWMIIGELRESWRLSNSLNKFSHLDRVALFWRVEFLPVTLVQVPTTQVVKTFCSQQSIKVGDHLFLWIRFPIWKEWLLLESWAPLFKCQLLGRFNNFAYTAIHKHRISVFLLAAFKLHFKHTLKIIFF